MYAHPSGQWAKKINKRIYYLGVWADPHAALTRLNREYPYLKEGKTPPAVDVSNGCTLRQLCNEFLRQKDAKLQDGDLSPRSFRDYYKTCELMLDAFGKERRVDDLQPADFRLLRTKLAQRFGSSSLHNQITRIGTVFAFAYDNQLIEKPVRYGQSFDRPSAKAIRRDRNAAGPKLFTREEVHRILGAADVQLRAMVLLGVNCGFGNSDVANLPQSALDLDAAWVSYPRVKTEVPRRIPLWPETVAALREAIAARPAPADATLGRLVFLTRLGKPWVRVQAKKRHTEEPADDAKEKPVPAVPLDALAQAFAKLLHRLEINGRKGIGFYTLRHCFETYAGESKDQVAVDAVMGHVDASMSAKYREGISDERLRTVVDTVRLWLFGNGPGDGAMDDASDADTADSGIGDAGAPGNGGENSGATGAEPFAFERPALRLYVG
jgi:integrase